MSDVKDSHLFNTQNQLNSNQLHSDTTELTVRWMYHGDGICQISGHFSLSYMSYGSASSWICQTVL